MATDTLSVDDIRRRGLEALRRELGVSGMIRFLQLFEPGKGDYTVDRHKWLGKLTLDEILSDMRKHEQEEAVSDAIQTNT